jgi:hypothetical protein
MDTAYIEKNKWNFNKKDLHILFVNVIFVVTNNLSRNGKPSETMGRKTKGPVKW